MKKRNLIKSSAVLLTAAMLLGTAPAALAANSNVSVPVGLEQNIDIASVNGEVTEFYAKNESGAGLAGWSVGQTLNGEYTDLVLSVMPEREGKWEFSYEYTYIKSGKTGSTSGTILVVTDGYKEPVPSTPEPVPVVTEAPKPTEAPTQAPVITPEPAPVVTEAPKPTEAPTPEPTEAPTPEPTEAPTPEPTEAPTPEPTEEPEPEPETPYMPNQQELESFSALAALQYGLDERGTGRDGQIYAVSCVFNITGDIPCMNAERGAGTMTVAEDELAAFFKSAAGTKFIRQEEDARYDLSVNVADGMYTFEYTEDPVSVSILSCEKNGDAVTVTAEVTAGMEAEPATVLLTAAPAEGYLGFRLA